MPEIETEFGQLGLRFPFWVSSLAPTLAKAIHQFSYHIRDHKELVPIPADFRPKANYTADFTINQSQDNCVKWVTLKSVAISFIQSTCVRVR